MSDNHNNEALVRGLQDALNDTREGLDTTPFDGDRAEGEIIGSIATFGAVVGRVGDALFPDDPEAKADWAYEIDAELATIMVVAGVL